MKRKSLFTKDFYYYKDNKFVRRIRKEARKQGKKLTKIALKRGYNPHEVNDIFHGTLNLTIAQCIAEANLAKECLDKNEN